MRFEVLDWASRAGGPVNEDALGIGQWGRTCAAWVLDGATGVAAQEYVTGAPSDAAWLARRLSDLLAANDPGDGDPRTYFARIIGAVAAEYRDAVPSHGDLPPYAMPSAAGTWIRAAGSRLDLAWRGDCVAVVEQGGEVQVFGAAPWTEWEDAINEVVARRLAQGPVRGKLQEVLGDELRLRRARLNQPGGYWMLGIDPRAAASMEVVSIEVTGPTRVLLCSDGLWRLVDHFHRYDGALLLEAAFQDGLAPLLAELRALEAEDPDCRAVPRVKPSDDASGLTLALDAG